ncbi:hypothetical protein FEI15_01555 [Lacticaseibacillus zeae]|uniref:Uncharacterized protein n=2 Tax=Lacticaseibacillus zeae TaxID=57037 RepID=A0A5R8LX60_LACZE|nr:hypothetical protein FEI15_01555 [Lacticaseibacillus zeae]
MLPKVPQRPATAKLLPVTPMLPVLPQATPSRLKAKLRQPPVLPHQMPQLHQMPPALQPVMTRLLVLPTLPQAAPQMLLLVLPQPSTIQVPVPVKLILLRLQRPVMRVPRTPVPVKPVLMHHRQVPVPVTPPVKQAPLTSMQVRLHQLLPSIRRIAESSLMQVLLPVMPLKRIAMQAWHIVLLLPGRLLPVMPATRLRQPTVPMP